MITYIYNGDIMKIVLVKKPYICMFVFVVLIVFCIVLIAIIFKSNNVILTSATPIANRTIILDARTWTA